MMAYCVHCGVKLGTAEAKCPLCGTVPCDPAEPIREDAPKPFPVRTLAQTLELNRRYSITLLSLLLLVPAGVCLVIDLIGSGITWSIYPAGVLALIWIAMVVPLLMPKHRLYSTIVITGATLAAYLYLVELVSETSGWFLPIVLPSLGAFVGMLCLTIWLIRSKHLRILRLVGVAMIEIGLLCFLIELLCVVNGVTPAISWSPYVMIPCVFVAVVLYVVSRNGPLATELKRRFHF